MKKLLTFSLATLAVLAAAMLATPAAVADDPTCFIFYQTDDEQAFGPDAGLEIGYAVDASEDGCWDAEIACFEAGYDVVEFDASWIEECTE